MSSLPPAPKKRINIRNNQKHPQKEDNNNSNKSSERQQARKFITWFNHMIDNERQNFCLYLSDDAMLEYFGRTIKTRKKVAAFLKHDMQCSRHDFTTVESIDKIQMRQEMISRRGEESLASPHSPEIFNLKIERPSKRRLPRCESPEWAEGCQPPDEKSSENKRMKPSESLNDNHPDVLPRNGVKRAHSEDRSEINSKGDSVLGRRVKRKSVPVTPPNCEVGQGDCLPSTSGTDSDRSHDTLNAQLPKLAVECNGYIEFTRTRNNRATDSMKWERKCKVQISYSEDPLNIGEYIIWALLYTDESKCRRNLLAAFEEVAIEEGLVK
ncbi:uncharacterized protein LOC106136653 [Amyelois transitella]|uniref:uncharacterized protein LOC106136653 n=1 Tax=Amyelois transitella TaxID=680683 RepID=UPI00067D33B6|nr:uncharacterized protein LOC106136653 [Amyelois transitella]